MESELKESLYWKRDSTSESFWLTTVFEFSPPFADHHCEWPRDMQQRISSPSHLFVDNKRLMWLMYQQRKEALNIKSHSL